MKPHNEEQDDPISKLEQLHQKITERMTADCATQYGLQPIKLQGPFVLLDASSEHDDVKPVLERSHELYEWQFANSRGVWVFLKEVDEDLQDILNKLEKMAAAVMDYVSPLEQLRTVTANFLDAVLENLRDNEDAAWKPLLIYPSDTILMVCELSLQRALVKHCKG